MKIALWFLLLPAIMAVPSSVAGNEITLDEAVRLALRENSRLQAARADASAAGREAEAVRKDYLPKLSAGARVLNQAEDMSIDIPLEIPMSAVVPGNPLTLSYNVSQPMMDHHMEEYTVRLVQPLTTLWKVRQGHRLAVMAHKFAETEQAAVANKIAGETVQACCFLLMADRNVELAQVNIQELEAHLSRIQSLFKVGHVLKRDLLQVELGLANARLERDEKQRQALTARQQLASLLDMAIDELPALKEPPDYVLPAMDLNALWEEADARRPELEMGRLGVEIACQHRRARTAGNIPDLALFGAYQKYHGNYMMPEENRIVGLSLEAEIFEWGKMFNERRADSARIRKAEATEREVRQSIRLEITNLFYELRNTWDRLQVAGKNLALAEESLRITQKLYDNGRATITDLLNDQTDIHDARTKRAIARYGLIIADARLRAGVGTLAGDFN